MYLTNFIRKEMKKQNITNVSLSKKVGYKNQANISLILTDRSMLPVRKIIPIAKALKVSPQKVYRLYMKDVSFQVLRESGLA